MEKKESLLTKMDVDEEIRKTLENMQNPDHVELSEDMSDEELLAKIEKYKIMTMRVCERIEETEWKIQKTRFIAEYEKKKFDECREVMRKVEKLLGMPPSQGPSKSLEEYRKEREAKEKKLDELDEEIREKRKRLLDMELTAKRKKLEEAVYMNNLLIVLEDKQEEERDLRETLKELNEEEERLNQASGSI